MKPNNRSSLGLARVSMGEMTALLAKYNALPEDAWDRLRQEQTDAGWGSTDTARIPANWREVRGPEWRQSAASRMAIGDGIKAAKNQKKKYSGGNKSGPQCFWRVAIPGGEIHKWH